MTRLIDENEEWIANDTIFVQVGDLIHRREQNVKVVQKLFEYEQSALAMNSDVLLVAGNHDFEQIKWNPANVAAFSQKSSWYMPDYELFDALGLNDKLRSLRLIFKVNGFVFVHAGIEAKHLKAAKTTNIEEINALMRAYFAQVNFANDDEPQFAIQRKVATMVWLQWLHDYRRKGLDFCDKVNEVLDLLRCHTMIVGHYFPSSEQRVSVECDDSIIFSDVGLWYNYSDAIIIEGETISTMNGQIIPNSIRRKAILATEKQEL